MSASLPFVIGPSKAVPPNASVQTSSAPLVYLIDTSDRLLTFQEPTLKSPNCDLSQTFDLSAHVGRSIFEFMGDSQLRLLYGMIYRGLRTNRRSIVLPFRADSAVYACQMELTLTVLANNAVLHESRLIHSEPLSMFSPWSASVPMSDEFMTICSWCQRIQQNDQWHDVEKIIYQQRLFERSALPQLTHGICPTCCASVLTKLKH